MLDGIFGQATQVMGKSLDALATRQRAIGENIANVDTPGYKRLEVGFEDQMQQALGQGDKLPLAVDQPGQLTIGPSAIADLQPQVVRVTGTTGRNDGNNVDIDVEMTKLAETNISYDTIARTLKQRFDILRGVIQG